MPVVSEEAVPRFRTSASGERRGKVAEKEGEDEKTIGNQRLDFFYFFPRERERKRESFSKTRRMDAMWKRSSWLASTNNDLK